MSYVLISDIYLHTAPAVCSAKHFICGAAAQDSSGDWTYDHTLTKRIKTTILLIVGWNIARRRLCGFVGIFMALWWGYHSRAVSTSDCIVSIFAMCLLLRRPAVGFSVASLHVRGFFASWLLCFLWRSGLVVASLASPALAPTSLCVCWRLASCRSSCSFGIFAASRGLLAWIYAKYAAKKTIEDEYMTITNL